MTPPPAEPEERFSRKQMQALFLRAFASGFAEGKGVPDKHKSTFIAEVAAQGPNDPECLRNANKIIDKIKETRHERS